jgi:hypothetical protein
VRSSAAFLVGGFALFGFLRRRKQQPQAQPVVDEPDPRAEELRQKLAESRAIVAEREEFESAETPVDEVQPLEDPETRRRAVHESARATAERMRERN